MRQSLVSPIPSGPGNSGAFLLFNFQSPANSPALRGQICGKNPAKCPRPLVDNNDYQQMTLIILNKLSIFYPLPWWCHMKRFSWLSGF